MTLYVLHKDGKLLITKTGRSHWQKSKHWCFRSKFQAETNAKQLKAEVVEYVPRLNKKNMDRKIITLCGSTKFPEAFKTAMLEETLAGKIVLTVGCFMHSDPTVSISEQQKKDLDKLHFDKIAMSDEVLILNVGGYIGESTKNELSFAQQLGLLIKFLDPEKGEEFLEKENI